MQCLFACKTHLRSTMHTLLSTLVANFVLVILNMQTPACVPACKPCLLPFREVRTPCLRQAALRNTLIETPKDTLPKTQAKSAVLHERFVTWA